MRTPRSSLFVLLALLAPLLACGMLKKKPPPEPSATATAPPAPPPTVAVPVPTPPPEVKVADEAIPTTEDFEDEAVEKVTDKSYKNELAALKKEIEAPK